MINWKERGRKEPWPILRCSLYISLGGMREKNLKTLRMIDIPTKIGIGDRQSTARKHYRCTEVTCPHTVYVCFVM